MKTDLGMHGTNLSQHGVARFMATLTAPKTKTRTDGARELRRMKKAFRRQRRGSFRAFMRTAAQNSDTALLWLGRKGIKL